MFDPRVARLWVRYAFWPHCSTPRTRHAVSQCLTVSTRHHPRDYQVEHQQVHRPHMVTICRWHLNAYFFACHSALMLKYSTAICPSTDAFTYPAHNHMHQHPERTHTTSRTELCRLTCTPAGAVGLKHVGRCHRGSLGRVSAPQTNGGQGRSKYTRQRPVAQGA